MEVYLVPVGGQRYELYCEFSDDSTAGHAPDAPGPIRRMKARFHEVLAVAEREWRESHRGDGTSSEAAGRPAGGARRRVLRRLAEVVAEQRLLWHLRKQHAATLVHPDDLPYADAIRITREMLQRDAERHRFWVFVDGAAFVVSGLLVLIPGPNLLAYYFGFRLVGHVLAWRGARRGLSGMSWSGRASDLLSELRHAATLAPSVRRTRVRDLAGRLKLEHLASFFERTVMSG